MQYTIQILPGNSNLNLSINVMFNIEHDVFLILFLLELMEFLLKYSSTGTKKI